MQDKLKRPLKDLRISVTDRCNFRCRYCMPAEIFGANYSFLPKEEILRFGEIVRLAEAMVGLGVRKLRITGGEPLLRRDLAELVSRLAQIPAVEDIAMTTNGVLLARHAEVLKSAGLQRVTVSLDAIDDAIFAHMNGVGAKPEKVMSGIDAALSVGMGVKLNCVLKKGMNESQILPLARFAKQRGIALRFIEYMDTGNSNQWKLDDVVPAAQVLEILRTEYQLEKIPASYPGETAMVYREVAEDETSALSIGLINSVTQPFCSGCNRIRLSADGHLFTCLFAVSGHDVKGLLRGGATQQELAEYVARVWGVREDRYSELRAGYDEPRDKAEMSYLGG